MPEIISLLFLDVDGVLNGPDARELHPDCVRNLNELLSRTGADVIVSSTWRKLYALYVLEDKLQGAGFRHRLAGFTPSLFWRHGERGDEIKLFLDTFPGRGHLRRVRSFVILDDDSDMGQLEHRLVQTETDKGLTQADVERAVKVLDDPIEDWEIELGPPFQEPR